MAQALGLGALARLCRRIALGDGTVQCRHHVLHLVDVPPLDSQARLESLHRPCEDQAVVDPRHAALAGRGLWRRGFHHTHGPLAAVHAVLLLGGRLHWRVPLRGRRRLLPARPRRASAGLVHGHTAGGRPPRHDNRPRRAGDGGRQPAGHLPRLHQLFVEPHVLRLGGHLHLVVAMALLRLAPRSRRQQPSHRERQFHIERLRPHVPHVHAQARHRAGLVLHRAFPLARGLALQGEPPVPDRRAPQWRPRTRAAGIRSRAGHRGNDRHDIGLHRRRHSREPPRAEAMALSHGGGLFAASDHLYHLGLHHAREPCRGVGGGVHRAGWRGVRHHGLHDVPHIL